ncbi:hypothetical protein BJV82DRAFT_664771 [Fennellomyces sp. T-0311]|nr:hypothetical protein BJV82DRAFT_664771 [Fennellomyces sp. T-0311]
MHGEPLESTWGAHVSRVAKAMNINLVTSRKKVDWANLALKIINRAPPASSSNSESSSATKTTGSKRSRSTSGSKADSCLLTEAQTAQFKASYYDMTDDVKWKLSDGTYVEDMMFKFGDDSDYEHPVHSFILDVDDPIWTENGRFTKEQMNEIREAGNPTLPILSDNVMEIINACAAAVREAIEKNEPSTVRKAVIDGVHQAITSNGFYDPYTQYDEDWLQSSLLRILSLYRYNTLSNITSCGGSEMDFVIRIWSLLDRCFDNLMVETRRGHTCIATSVRENSDRAATGQSSVEQKQQSVRPDLILFRNGVEFGTAECGKADDDGVWKKEIVEWQLHNPKVMKDMFLRAVSRVDNDLAIVRKLRIIGLNQNHIRMRPVVLDCPKGYVSRLRGTKPFEISSSPSSIPSGVLPILMVTLQMKEILRQSMALIGNYHSGVGTTQLQHQPDFQCNADKSKSITLPAVICTKDKRQKI